MDVYGISVGAFEVNCWIVAGIGRQALVIDPGADAERISAVLDEHALTVAAYVLTHGHMDHISALAELHRERRAPVALHEVDAGWAFTDANRMPPFYDQPAAPDALERFLADGQTWNDAGLRYRIIGTPGHTPGSVCLWFEDEQALFSGDTLFAGSIGRTDFPGGDMPAMQRSLETLIQLPDETRIYPGHGPLSTIAREKRTNMFMARP